MNGLSRRTALAMLSASALAACSHRPQDTAQPVTEEAALKDIAAAKGIRFGSAMSAWQLKDPHYVALMQRDCATMVAENEHKFYAIHPQPDEWNWAPGDALVAFAQANAIAMRGHTLVWHHPRWLPDWVNNTVFVRATEAEVLLGDYVTRVASRHADVIYAWDVINETIDDQTGEQRETSFSRAMGPEVIEFCFHTARAAAPKAKLAYNDYMSWERGNEKHRAGVLRLLERLRKNGAPIDALGIQSHSNYDMPDEFTAEKQKSWRAFLDEVTGMGLDVYITEFDVNDTRLAPDIASRDAKVATYTRDYLDLMLSYPQVKDVLMWGLVDSQSWLQGFLPRTDGVEKRPTLYDSSYQPKLMRDAVAAALRAAPVRQA